MVQNEVLLDSTPKVPQEHQECPDPESNRMEKDLAVASECMTGPLSILGPMPWTYQRVGNMLHSHSTGGNKHKHDMEVALCYPNNHLHYILEMSAQDLDGTTISGIVTTIRNNTTQKIKVPVPNLPDKISTVGIIYMRFNLVADGVPIDWGDMGPYCIGRADGALKPTVDVKRKFEAIFATPENYCTLRQKRPRKAM